MHLPHIHCLLFDLDDTLYEQSNGVWDMIRARINQYLVEEMRFPPEEVPALRHRLWQQYGTTLRGLQEEYAVDMDAYLDYVHDIPLERVLKPNPDLDRTLHQFPQQKIIFTNASASHARRVVQALKIEGHFSEIVDIYAMHPFCKPQIEAFQKALAVIDEKPKACLLIDDSPQNLNTARNLGMSTIAVGRHAHDGSPHIDTILDLPEVVFS
jgi:putative hydrolase of the HAD superfamily